MNYIDYEEQLDKTVRSLPQEAQVVFSELPIISMMEQIGGGFNLSMGEIGEMCELVRQIIAKEREPKDFESGLTEKLDEENREKVPDIVVVLSQALFSMLLPALNIKVPIELAVRVAPPKVEGLEIAPLAPAHPTQTKRVAPPSASVPPPPVTRSVPHQNYQTSNASFGSLSKPQGFQSNSTRPPIMETSHESMAINPLESLMQMLEGKVSQRDLSRQFEKLPDSLKNALGSVDSAKKVVDIGRKYALHMDKLGELGAETGMVILGFTHPAQFLSRLTKRLGLSEEKVRPIAQEINIEVFLKIREALKQVNGEAEARSTPTPTETIPAKPQEPPTEQQPEKSSAETEYQNLASMNSAASPIPMKPEGNIIVSETEEVLDREAILRDIENPTPVNSGFQPLAEKIQNSENFTEGVKPEVATPPEPKNIPIKPRGPSQPATTVTATGTTEIPQRAAPTSGQIPSKVPAGTSFMPSLKNEVAAPWAPEPPVPVISMPEKAPALAVAFPPFTPPPAPKPEVLPNKPQNIVDQKLSGATSSTKSEGKYAADPYRETLG